MSRTTVIHSARLARTEEIQPGWLSYTDGIITGIGTGEPPPAHTTIDAQGGLLVPGFIDLHNHGGGGHSFTDADHQASKQAIQFHAAHGTTTMLASLVTAPHAHMVAACRTLAELAEARIIAGIHLEGPFLSPARCGAQNPEFIVEPDLRVFDELIKAGRGHVKQITIAPELPHALEVIRAAVAGGITVAIGHTDASYDRTVTAIAAGASLATHLFNGLRPMHHRDPGPITALLESPEVTLEIIADGAHVHEALLRFVFTHCGPGRIALITDAIAAAGSPDGQYQLSEQHVTVRGGIATLSQNGALAGSTTTQDAALRRCIAAGIPPLHAITALTSTPARVLNLHDRGTLRLQARADLVLLDNNLTIRQVIAQQP
ncbi:MAG: N-acetylglucosamine-6-phosphate deacetylase [Corynebacteriales bacterium]|nr:N-acetylglucosamine-6-phosphate deacetylase [Mycobacteriales bacterium]